MTYMVTVTLAIEGRVHADLLDLARSTGRTVESILESEAYRIVRDDLMSDEVAQLWRLGLRDSEIMAGLGLSRRQVYNRRTKFKLPPNPTRKARA